MTATARTVLPALMLALAPPPASAALPPQPAAPAAEDDRSTPAPQIEIAQEAGDDDRIAGRLSDIFSNVPSLSDVSVAVGGGVVSLGGTAADAAAIERAEAIAAGVEGVVTVENAITRDVSIDVGAQVGTVRDLASVFLQSLPLLGLAVLLAAVIAGFGYLLASLTGFWRRVTPNIFLAELIASALRFGFVLLGLVVALDMLGAGALLGAVLGGAGVIGLALGFAMRDTVENYVSSLMLSLRQPFRANDWVMIDQHEGRVVRLTSRASILMTLDGNHLRIPNAQVFKAVIVNYTTNPQRRFDFTLGVDADDDPEAARTLGREVLGGLPFVLADPPPEVRIAEVGDSSVILRFLGWIDQREANWFKVRSRAIVATKQALEEAGFGLPEPIYRLRFDPRTTPLPVRNLGAEDTGEHTPAPPPKGRTATRSAEPADDLASGDEIARMVEEERAGEQGGGDLLDGSRPTE